MKAKCFFPGVNKSNSERCRMQIMKTDRLNPILLNEPFLSSFASIREKNLRTLYGDTTISEYINNDRSPKGSVDEKIRPLVNLINLHPEFVTLSSCSGRVAMFDPIGSCDHQHESIGTGELSVDESYNNHLQQKAKGTEISGKGRGKWIFITHDILPNLSELMIESLKLARTQRLQTIDTNNSPITFKYEPPLLHIAASSLAAAKKLLHIAKSTCAMRESGLVVTDQRVTVEIRTTGTLLCLPLFVQSGALQPEEDYLTALADLANKRMEQNTVLLEKLYDAFQSELFELFNCQAEEDIVDFNISLEPLPSLNLWKCASVAIPSNDHGNDVDIIAFGGQGIGPILEDSSNKTQPCRRWDAIFRLSRENGAWAKSWSRLSITTEVDTETITLETSAGTFAVNREVLLGSREGHTACVLPHASSSSSRDTGVVIFGGRTGGPMSPSNDLFIFMLQDKDRCVIGAPLDVRGSPPVPRFGHTMNALPSKQRGDAFPLAVVAGGYSGKAALSCIHLLSRIVSSDTGISHLLWERVADMPLPRCYHSAAVKEVNQGADELFVFGGMSKPDDPFSPNKAFVYRLPIRGEGTVASKHKLSEDAKLPESIGAAACSFFMQPDKSCLMLLFGGVRDEHSSHKGPFHILKWNLDASGTIISPKSARYSVTECEGDFDLGSLVHHNMISLDCSNSGSISAVIIGGGVPSFSFGQTFARSFAVSIELGLASARHEQNDTTNTSTLQTAETKPNQRLNNRIVTDVIYVAPCNAKSARLELEKLGYFDWRYKLVKVEANENKGEKKVVIGLPITKHFKSLCLSVGEEGLLKSEIIGLGEETVSFSSSQMSKIGNKM